MIMLILMYQTPLFGYLDPGSGSILVYFIIGLFATLMYSLKNLIFKIKNTFLKIFSNHKIDFKKKKNIVFYSEGGQYYEVFRPVIEKLTKMKIYCSYYTSDKKDKGLEYKNKYCDSVFIGESQFAIMSLNYLSAKILIMTTPQIEVMHLKRSKNVDYFVHLVHSLTHMFNYKPFAFDSFDCVMCSAQHQIDNIRLIEKARNLPPKNLLKTGLTYFDGLLQNKQLKQATNNQKTILISPTWGEFGLLSKTGFKILEILANANFKVICRPHPQSFINEKDLMNEIVEKSKLFKQIEIDTRPTPNYAMNLADIMIADIISGIIFDFSFIYEKPVLVFESTMDDDNFTEFNEIKTYFNIDKQVCKLAIMYEATTTINFEELSNLQKIINKNLDSNNKNIKAIKDKSIFNYGLAGEVCAKQLEGLLKGQTL